MQYEIDEVAEQGGLPDPRRAAEEEHRHRHGPGAGGLPAAGRRQHVRDRRGRPGAAPRRRARRGHVRRRPRGRRPAARGGRPRAQRPHAHRRRRHAGQRGPRLHPAPAAAPRRPLDEAARRRGGHPARAAAGVPRRDERQLPRARHRLRPHLRRRVRRGGGVPAHPHAPGRRCSRPPSQQAKKAGTPALSGEQAFSPARHVRLPDRRHPRDGRRAGRDRRRGGLPRADEGAARPRPRRLARQAHRLGRRPGLPPAAGRARADRLAGLRHPAHRLPRPRRRPRGTSDAAPVGGAGRDHPGRAGPHAVLRRVRRPGGRRRRSSPGTAAGPRSSTCSGPVKGLVAHQVRVLEGELREGAELTAEVDYELAAVRLPGALGHPRRARRAAPGARPAGPAVGLLQPARLPAAGLRLAGRAHASSSAPTSRTSPTPPSAPTTRSPRST